MVTENGDYGPREAFREFSEYVEDELEEEVPFDDKVDGVSFFNMYEKFAVNAQTHLTKQIEWLDYLKERSEPLRESEEEYGDFLEGLDSAFEHHSEVYAEIIGEVYSDGEFDDEAVLSKATPVEEKDGKLVSELEMFVSDIYTAGDSAENDVETLKEEYGKIADGALSEPGDSAYGTDRNKPLKTEATEEDIEKINNITSRLNSVNSEIEENTRRM